MRNLLLSTVAVLALAAAMPASAQQSRSNQPSTAQQPSAAQQSMQEQNLSKDEIQQVQQATGPERIQVRTTGWSTRA